MPTLDQIRRTIARIDGASVLAEADARHMSHVYLDAFYAASCNGTHERNAEYRRADALGDVDGDPDDNDTNHRSARGANSAVKSSRTMPDVSNMDLGAVKAVALSVGAYASSIRRELATKVLDRLRELGAPSVADMFAKAWQYGDLDKQSDDEAERSGAAHSDEEELAKARLRTANRETLASPSKADAVRAKSAIAKARSK